MSGTTYNVNILQINISGPDTALILFELSDIVNPDGSLAQYTLNFNTPDFLAWQAKYPDLGVSDYLEQILQDVIDSMLQTQQQLDGLQGTPLNWNYTAPQNWASRPTSGGLKQ